MSIKKAESAGFCFGVNRAINIVNDLIVNDVKVNEIVDAVTYLLDFLEKK